MKKLVLLLSAVMSAVTADATVLFPFYGDVAPDNNIIVRMVKEDGDDKFEQIHGAFLELADSKKEIYDDDLHSLMGEQDRNENAIYRLDAVQISCGQPLVSTATVTITDEDGEVCTVCEIGSGPIDAMYSAINKIVQAENDLMEYSVNAVTRGIDALGEVTVRIFTDEPEERFAPGAELFNRDGSVTYTVERARTFKNRWYLKLEGVDDRNAAEELNGTVLYGEPWELEDDEFYPKDLVGLEARLKADGRVLGKVVDMIEGAQWLLKIRLTQPVGDETTALVPFVIDLVPDIDLEEGYLTIDPPGGLIPGV